MSILITQKLDIIENKIWCKNEKQRKKMIKEFESDYYMDEKEKIKKLQRLLKFSSEDDSIEHEIEIKNGH